jgi:dimethylglycine dehydrogenase
MVRRATGGKSGFRVEKSLALAMVHPEHATVGTELEMAILGARHRVTVIPDSPYDPENQRLRTCLPTGLHTGIGTCRRK